MKLKEGNGWHASFFLALDEKTVKENSEIQLARIALRIGKEKGFLKEFLTLFERIWKKGGDAALQIRAHYNVPATYPQPYEQLESMPVVDVEEGFERAWYKGRVCLIGDAAHAAPNFLAQGMAMGVEDACELVLRLTKGGYWKGCEEGVEEVFEIFSKGRLERICYFQNKTLIPDSDYDDNLNEKVFKNFFGYQLPGEDDMDV